jgi:HNH endonuclease
MRSPTPLIPNFRWRFATMTPSEGLLKLPILLGVTRCFATSLEAEDSRGRFLELLAELKLVLGDSCEVDLVRTRERDLLRNSGQYWSVLGLIENRELTPLGIGVANGTVSPHTFASHSIADFRIPHRCYDEPTVQLMQRAGIEIRPLLLMLEVIETLRSSGSDPSITLEELQSIVVPGSAARLGVEDMSELIATRRRLGPRFRDEFGEYLANDRRTLREFLLYLCGVGLLQRCDGSKEETFAATTALGSTAYSRARSTGLASSAAPSQDLAIGPDSIERAITEVRRTARPNQGPFRRRVFELCHRKCIITGECVASALEAAHLRSVEAGGSDHHSNGIVLRADLHRLFDAGLLRLGTDGTVVLSAEVRNSATYRSLPARIAMPPHVDLRQVAHRFMTSC